MKIKSLKIRNFRSYSNKETSEIRLGPGTNAIVGKNNVGKSAILQALMYIKGDIDKSPVNNFAGAEGDVPFIEITTDLSPSEIDSFCLTFISDLSNKKDIINFQIQNFPEIVFQFYRTHQIRIGPFPVQDNKIYSTEYNLENKKERNIKNWETEDATQLKKTYLMDVIKNIFDHINQRNDENNYIFIQMPLFSYLLNLLKNNIKIFPEFRQRPGGTDQMKDESYDGSFVASVLNTLKNGDSRQVKKWRKIMDEFSKFYPSLILDVRRVPGQNPIVWIGKRDIDYDVTIDKVGGGISEFIVFITHLIDVKNTIFCLDNSEIHFHPHAQRKLMNMIESYSKNNQFILVTHSPNFIKLINLSNIIIVKEEKSCSVINQLIPNWFTQNEIQKLDRDMTPEMREIFFSDFVFFVEGLTETGAIPIFAEAIGKNFDDRNISIVKVAGKYFDIPIKLCRGFNLPYLVMCDRDALMNIEISFGRGENGIECSSIIRLLLTLKLLSNNEKELIYSPKSIEKKGSKKRYNKDLFIPLQEIAKKHNIFISSSTFETILKKAGYKKYFDEIEKQGIHSKPIIGKYVATKIVENKEPIPDQFIEVLNQIPK